MSFEGRKDKESDNDKQVLTTERRTKQTVKEEEELLTLRIV